MNISPEKIAPSVAFSVVGLIMIIVGSTGIVPIGNPQPVISEFTVRLILIVLGSVLLLLGPVLVWREITASKPKDTKSEKQPKDSERPKCNIRVISPVTGKRFKGKYGNLTVEVAGTYKVKPPLGTKLRLFVMTENPTSYWRHPAVVDFDDSGNRWYGKIDLWMETGMQPYEARIVAAILDKVGEDMVQYASKVQQETGRNIPFDTLPSHIEKCEDEILVFRA